MESLQPLLENLIPSTYVRQGLQNIHEYHNKLDYLLRHQKLPANGWDDQCIRYCLQELAMMDSNNFKSNTGVGEREGRVYSNLVRERHYGFAHGIGRSGDIVEVQPKAAGSSIIYKLTNKLASEAMRVAGLSKDFACIVFPLATGMTIAFALKTLKQLSNPTEEGCTRKYVIWSRIDQKSCLKSIVCEGLVPIVVEPLLNAGDELVTNLAEIERILMERHTEILCVISTTSCFAPRQPDLVDGVAELCARFGVGHLINNAYGLQCGAISKSINRALLKGRVDAIVQSTDKNFLVPVGGAIVASSHPLFLQTLSGTYPGRANISPVLDLFITLLSLGEQGYKDLLKCREEVVLPYLRGKLEDMCTQFGLALLPSPRNKISFAVSLSALCSPIPGSAAGKIEQKKLTFLGAMLYQRNISGCRVVLSGPDSEAGSSIANIPFISWGAHLSRYPHSYFTVACAIGMKLEEVDVFVQRFQKALKKFLISSSSSSVRTIDANIGNNNNAENSSDVNDNNINNEDAE